MTSALLALPRKSEPPPACPPACPPLAAVMLNCEGMTHDDQSKLISTYRRSFPCYSDSAHGLPTVVLAGILAAMPATGGKLADHRYMLVRPRP